MLRTLRLPFEYALARIALWVVPRLPRRTVLRWANLLGRLAFRGIGRQRRVARANLALALPGLSNQQQDALLVKSLQGFALAMLDTFWLARDTAKRIPALVSYDESFARTIFQPGAQICLTAHMGNWEVLGLSVSLRGFPLTSVTAPLKNPWVDHLFNQLRNLTGQHTVPKQGAVRALLKTLRSGGKIALVMDQNTKPVHGGVFVDFFGCKAPFSSAAARLALRTGAPIYLGTCLADDQGGYHCPPVQMVDKTGLSGDESTAILELTQRIARGLEDMIRRYPQAWLWTYKRWKIRPDGEDPGRYPYYTRAIRPGDVPPSSSEIET